MTAKKNSRQYWKRKPVRSGLEARIREDLDQRKVDYGYETIKLKYVKDECKHCGFVTKYGQYTPDFIIARDSGIRLVVESKGRFDSASRTKMLRVKRDHIREDIRFLFQRDQTIRKGSSTRYSDWCIKYGFPFAIGESIPEEWIREDKKTTMDRLEILSCLTNAKQSNTNITKKLKRK